MTSDGFTMGASGIGPCDPAQVSRFLCKHYVVMVSKANRDELVEFCHLVVLLDLKNKSIPQDLGALVDCVMKNPQPNQVQEAVWKLKEYADSLRPDPRKASSAVADAWRQSKKIREGKAVEKLDESLISQPPSSNEGPKGQVPIQVQVWSQTQGKLEHPASEIRCSVPSLSMVGNLENIIRYAASAGFNFPMRDGKPWLKKAEKVNLSSKAMLFSKPSDKEWVLRDKSTRLGEVVAHSSRLQIVNTKLKTLAVAVVIFRKESAFLFDIHKPLDLVDTLQRIVTKPQVLRNIDLARSSFIQTRFLRILPEEVALPPAAPSNHNPQHAIHSSVIHSPDTPPLGSSPSISPGAAPPAVHPQPKPPPPKAGLPEIVGTQPPEDHRIDNPRSPSPTSSHYSDAQEDVEPPGSEVHGYARIQQPARTLSNAPSTNPMPVVSASSSSSIVVVPSVTQSAILSSPEDKAIVTPEVPAQKPGPDSFFKRIRRKIGW